MGDAEYVHAMDELIMPVATSFDPDIVLVSAGFDGARGDPLGGCDITPAGYAHMAHRLLALAGGRMAVVLEGGYNLGSIAVMKKSGLKPEGLRRSYLYYDGKWRSLLFYSAVSQEWGVRATKPTVRVRVGN